MIVAETAFEVNSWRLDGGYAVESKGTRMSGLYSTAKKLIPRPVKRRLLKLRSQISEKEDFSWTVKSGLKIQVASKSDWVIYNDIFVDGEYDFTIKEALGLAVMDRNLTVLDLGANVGFFTLRFLDLLRQSDKKELGCRITLVEGSPAVAISRVRSNTSSRIIRSYCSRL
jgi:hypothetical protein